MQGTGVGETDRIRASTGDDDVGLRLEAFLPYRLSVLTNKISASLAAIYHERFGISIPEWRALAHLSQPASSAMVQALSSDLGTSAAAEHRALPRSSLKSAPSCKTERR